NMADENVPAPAPTRTDDQILPFAAWVPIRKSNYLGYTEEIHFVSRMAVKNLFQPWRAILSMINQCITGKTSRFDRPRYPVLQMFWGIVTCINVDYAELMWEEFVQAIQTFLTDKANQEDIRLGNLKFVPKGEKDEVFRMQIPNELITDSIRNAPYYKAYMEMVAKYDSKIAVEKEGRKEKVNIQGKVLKKVRKEKSPLKLVDKEEEVQHEPVPELQELVRGVAIREPVPEMTQKLPEVEDQFILQRRIPVAEEASIGPSTQPQDDISEKVI
ncbi:hypothetical protein Tco_1249387, partial [Tanacetum coccineum]